MGGATAVAGLKIGKEFRMPARSRVYARKPHPVRAIKMDTEFTVDNSEGGISGLPGEYLIQDAQGDFHVMSPVNFEKMYEQVKIGGERI